MSVEGADDVVELDGMVDDVDGVAAVSAAGCVALGVPGEVLV